MYQSFFAIIDDRTGNIEGSFSVADLVLRIDSITLLFDDIRFNRLKIAIAQIDRERSENVRAKNNQNK